MDLIPVKVTRNQIEQSDQLLRRFNLDTEKLTEVTVISKTKGIPEATATVRYEAIPLDQLVGEKCEGWDGASPITIYFNPDGQFDHFEETAGATAGAAA